MKRGISSRGKKALSRDWQARDEYSFMNRSLFSSTKVVSKSIFESVVVF